MNGRKAEDIDSLLPVFSSQHAEAALFQQPFGDIQSSWIIVSAKDDR
jgi:hypothetical protein